MEGRTSTQEDNHLLKKRKDLDRSRGTILSLEDWNLNKRLKDIHDEKKELTEIWESISVSFHPKLKDILDEKKELMDMDS